MPRLRRLSALFAVCVTLSPDWRVVLSYAIFMGLLLLFSVLTLNAVALGLSRAKRGKKRIR